MKKLAFFLSLAVFSLSLTILQAAPIEMKLSHFGAENHPSHAAAKMFAENVEKRTKGQVKIVIFPNNALGDPPQVLEQVFLGAVDMSLSGQDQLAKYVKMFDCVSIPFAFKGPQHVDKVLDGPFKAWAASELEKKGMIYLSSWDWGFRQVTNSVRPINGPDDLKGLKIRTPPALAYQEFVKACGGIVQTISFAELVMAMKQGVVDGQENPIGVIYSLKLYETQKYISIVNYTYSSMTHVVAKKSWDKLSKEQQKIFAEESTKAGVFMRKQCREIEKTQIEEMKKSGIQIAYPDISKFRAKMGPAYEVLKKSVGEGNFDKFMKMCDSIK
jgi:TRAP-type transport system periplasmic protein